MPYELENNAISKNLGFENFLPFLTTEVRRLENAGADFIVMPCNSLHVFIEDLRNAVKIPVLSIIEETVKFLKINNFKKVGIVSTSATIQNKLYETAFEKNQIEYLKPNDLQQTNLGKIILNLVSGQKNNHDRQTLIQIINDFEKENVDCVLLACTDLQLLKPIHPRLKIIDTMKILADSTVKEILS